MSAAASIVVVDRSMSHLIVKMNISLYVDEKLGGQLQKERKRWTGRGPTTALRKTAQLRQKPMDEQSTC